MVTKVQKMLNSIVQRILLKIDTKIDYHSKCLCFKNFQNGRHFKMAINIKIKQIVKNSKMNRFQWKCIFTGSKSCCTVWQPFRFPMVVILNQKWPPQYKNPPIWTKFGFHHDSQKLGSNYFLLCSHTILHSTTSTCIVRLGDSALQ